MEDMAQENRPGDISKVYKASQSARNRGVGHVTWLGAMTSQESVDNLIFRLNLAGFTMNNHI